MSHGDRSATERRNTGRVADWGAEWSLPGGSVARGMAELYADGPEVVSVLAGVQVAASGEAHKQPWAEAEVAVSEHYESRSIPLAAMYPSGDTVAVEARLDATTHDGEHRGWPFAVFLTFDASGKIVRDHTYRSRPAAGVPWVARQVGSPVVADAGSSGAVSQALDERLLLTATERRNLEGLEAYCAAWALPGGSVIQGVDEVYGDNPEVSLVLQGVTAAPGGGSKESWRRNEAEVESRFRRRAVLMDAVYPSGDTIAAEGRMDMETNNGRRLGWPFAVFLTFQDGRIVVDHTYMERNENISVHEESDGAAA